MASTSGHEPRIAMLSIEDAKKAAASEGISEAMAPLSVFRILLKNPPLARELGNTLNMLLFQGNQLDARLRELIIMRIGWVTGSCYEWTQHWRVCMQLDIPEEVVLACRSWENADVLTDADRAVLRATDETLDSGRISPQTWAECAKHSKNDAELLEMVVAIGNWRLFSQLLLSLEVPLEEGVEAWAPDGLPAPRAPKGY